jgi:RimJ/RimL family protein N-acetyltransferase
MYREIGEYIIRDWQMEDAPSIAKYANNRSIWRNLRDAFPHPYRIQDAESFISRIIGMEPITTFAISSQSEAIGSIGLMPGKDVHRYTAEMGYWLAEPFWDKGIMTRAVKSMADYAIHDLKMHRVFAEPFTTNPASARVLTKAGFTCEGILRSSVFKDGKVLDQYLYSCIGKASTQPDAPPNTKGHAALGIG